MGEIEEQPSQPPSKEIDDNNTNNTHNDVLHIPSLASKFEELIAALPPLPMATPRPKPRKSKQGAKRKRGNAATAADSLLYSPQNRTPVVIKEQRQRTQHGDNTAPSPDSLYSPASREGIPFSSGVAVGLKIGIWLPSTASPSPSDDTVPRSSLPKNGSYHFGRVIAYEDVPPFRHLVKYDNYIDEVEKAFLNLENEIWVALSEDAAAAVGAGDNTVNGQSVPTQDENGAEKAAPMATELENKKKAKRHCQPVLFKNENFSVYKSTCGPPGYEIYANFPELRLEDIKVKCYARGKVQLTVLQPEIFTPRAVGDCGGGDGGGGQGVEKVFTEPQSALRNPYTVDLPSRIVPESAKALFTSTGQLYIRVNCEK